MSSIADTNQYAALQSSPIESESKTWQQSARGAKDDAKEQAHQLKTQMKSKAVDLKEQVVAGAQKGVKAAKQKAADLSGKPELADASNDELEDAAQDAAQEGWTEMKKRGSKAVQKGAEQLDAKLDEKLTPQQRAKLDKGVRQAKATGREAKAQAEGLFNQLTSAPQLRPFRNFVVRNNLQLPVMIFGALITLWLSLTLIRLITTATTPQVPEFDIHSKEASLNWLKWHAGEYKDRAVDMKESLASRAAHFLANHDLDKLQERAVDWRDVAVNKLGLSEPTWGEWAWSYVTGRPLTWQGRVMSVLDLAKTGLKTAALKNGYANVKGAVNDKLGLHEPSLLDRVLGRDTTLQGQVKAQANSLGERVSGSASDVVDSVKNTVHDTLNTIREHIPGTEAAELVRQKAYEAAHPHSTLDNIKSGAEYIKNRVIHGAEEAKHIAEDAAKKAMDEAKYKTGL